VPNLPAHSATLAGRNVSLALYVQALDQLWDTYGQNGGETTLSNCHQG
jgi:type IV secretory pathway TraG/TraD family ATPase VirD4